MRHRRRGRKLGRNPSHQRALLRSLASALILTEAEAEGAGAAKVKGRIVTTLPKAKEVRPLVEKCVTIACRAVPQMEAAEKLVSNAERHSEKWRAWRTSPQWNEWNQAVAPVVAARRQVLRLLGSKAAVKLLFDTIAERFVGRPGGYTRILRLARPRLGDAGTRAVLEFVGVHDRTKKRAPKPVIEPEPAPSVTPEPPKTEPSAVEPAEAQA